MKLLKKLSETPGIPGREERVRDLIRKETASLFDSFRVDPIGNLVCVKKPGKKPTRGKAKKVMLACHIDEIGFYVRYIDDKGFLRVHNVGGFDAKNLCARRVLVQGKKDLLGVMNPGTKPIHLASEEEKKKKLEVSDFYIDLFLPPDEAKKLVTIGDPVTLWQPLEKLGSVFTGKALDNRIASWVAINAVRKAKATSLYEVHYAATVQEEVGCRGAGPCAYEVNPDVGGLRSIRRWRLIRPAMI